MIYIRNHYIVANLTVVVHSAEDCCASSMKLRVPKKVVLFIVYLSIILTLFILSTLFDKDYTKISYICIRKKEKKENLNIKPCGWNTSCNTGAHDDD